MKPNYFLVDEIREQEVSYEKFSSIILQKKYCYPYFVTNNLIDFYSNLVASILSNNDVTLLDFDYSSDEISRLIPVGQSTDTKLEVDFTGRFSSIESMVKAIRTSSSRISLFTSGTTGEPKRITHSVQNFLRSTRMGEQFRQSVWGFCYNPTHMAGMQVFFQVIMNQSKMVNLFSGSKEFVFSQIEHHCITHLSATPTFYKLLTPSQKRFETVKRVTLGGEKSDKRLYALISELFPKAKLNNIYASTEAGSLFFANEDIFTVPEPIAEKVKILENELLLHQDLIGIDGSPGDELWHSTGDIVEIIENSPLVKFRFVDRKNRIVNIAGNRVSLDEVEKAIATHDAVKNVVVIARSNSVVGHILIAHVQLYSNVNCVEKEIRDYLKPKIQQFKIPPIIKFVEQIETTRTGKVKTF